MSDLNLSIIKIRVELQKTNLRRSGYNKFAKFDYFELKDFLPKLNELMLEEEINDIFTIENDYAILTLIKGEQSNVYKLPYKEYQLAQIKGIQALGSMVTYYKRYLYMSAFGITENDTIDSLDNKIDKPIKPVKIDFINEETINKIKDYANLQKALEFYKVFDIEELTQEQGEAVLRKMQGKTKGKLSDLKNV